MLLGPYIIESRLSIDQRKIYGLEREQIAQETLCKAACPWSRDRKEEDKVKLEGSTTVCILFLQREDSQEQRQAESVES